jgi:hypothetical protein
VTLPSTAGTYTVKASFAGDGYFDPASRSVSFRVTG